VFCQLKCADLHYLCAAIYKIEKYLFFIKNWDNVTKNTNGVEQRFVYCVSEAIGISDIVFTAPCFIEYKSVSSKYKLLRCMSWLFYPWPCRLRFKVQKYVRTFLAASDRFWAKKKILGWLMFDQANGWAFAFS
jgi:hypothetical protein